MKYVKEHFVDLELRLVLQTKVINGKVSVEKILSGIKDTIDKKYEVLDEKEGENFYLWVKEGELISFGQSIDTNAY